MRNKFISIDSECLSLNKREYESQLSFNSSRIRQDKKIELDMKQEYSGRELFEMIQNADDEASPKIELILTDENHFHIKNWGQRPFTENGLLSIMRSFLSPKVSNTYSNAAVRPIGNKGLGFRSLLNWSDEVTIHSNGVQCSFSVMIARSEWEEIKRRGIAAGSLSLSDVDAFESEREGGLPLPILSIPCVQKDYITKSGCYELSGNCTTDIEVFCKQKEVVDDIEKKLRSLNCSVLLFLRNIQEIMIDCKGEKRILKKESIEEKEIDFRVITLSTNDVKTRFAVCGFQSEDNKFEVGVAYPIDNVMLDNNIYCYFPTQVRLDVPAIYHGTFELNASRNHLVESEQNTLILKKLGEVAIKLSVYIIKYDLYGEKAWDPFRILDFPQSDIESAKLEPLAESVNCNLNDASIFPIVNNTFATLDSTIKINDRMAIWLQKQISKIPDDNPLSKHIISSGEKGLMSNNSLSLYVNEKIHVPTRLVADDLEVIASITMTIEDRTEFIAAIYDNGACNKNMSLLVDAGGKVLKADSDNPSYVLSMTGNVLLPQCLHIYSVDAELISNLQKIWNLPIRQVTERLRRITNVINGDHTAIRRKIESWSANEMDYEGMCEVLRWEYHNPTQDASHFSSDLRLLNRLGERCKSCLLVLEEPSFPDDLFGRIQDNWILINSLDEWKEILGAETVGDVLYFMYNVIGVSQRVPCEHVYFGNKITYLSLVRDENNKSLISMSSCDNFNDNNRNTKQYNYSYVPHADFLKDFSVTEALGLIMLDDRAYRSVTNNNIALIYHTLKSETVKYSFAAYELRNSKQMSLLKQFVIQSNIFNSGIDCSYLENNLSLDRIKTINPLLATLGAQTSLSDVSLEELYKILAQKGEPTGVQRRYKEIREAIRDKNESAEYLQIIRAKYLTHVWARKRGRLQWTPINEVYYWDNDQLPQNILADLPKLEIGNRVGEDSVAKIFGVRLAKNVTISFTDSVENQGLTNELRKYIDERKKYFLAYRVGDDVKESNLIRQTVNTIKKLSGSFYIYKSATYSIDGIDHEMTDGDIITSPGSDRSGMSFHICSLQPNCVSAITDPMFCENINEAVCMALKVTSSTMSNYFRNIITHDILYIDYISKKDIAPENWKMIAKYLGVRDKEQSFWLQYSECMGEEIDISEMGDNVLNLGAYLKRLFPYLMIPDSYTGIENLSQAELYAMLHSMKCPDCRLLGDNGLKDYYMQYFEVQRNQYQEKFNSSLYHTYSEKLLHESDALALVQEYHEKCLSFSKPFYEEQAEKIKYRIVEDDELNEILQTLINERFGFSVDTDSDFPPAPLTILPVYESILSEYHLSEGSLEIQDVLIAKFDGLVNLFRENLKKYDSSDIVATAETCSELNEKVVVEISSCHSVMRDLQNEVRKKSKQRYEKGHTSDRSKYNYGKKAELATFEAMKQSPLFEDVYGHSRILNKESGDDNLHYDITYRKAGTAKTDVRYLEVKNISGRSIFMSCLEYEFAKANSESYDFALFHDGKVSIIEKPFSSQNGRKAWDVQPDTYQITIKWD